jgi:hypothetical protein
MTFLTANFNFDVTAAMLVFQFKIILCLQSPNHVTFHSNDCMAIRNNFSYQNGCIKKN